MTRFLAMLGIAVLLVTVITIGGVGYLYWIFGGTPF